MAKNITLPSDQSIAISAVNTLESMERTFENDAVFEGVHPKEKEALLLAVRKAATCARNVRRSLR